MARESEAVAIVAVCMVLSARRRKGGTRWRTGWEALDSPAAYMAWQQTKTVRRCLLPPPPRCRPRFLSSLDQTVQERRVCDVHGGGERAASRVRGPDGNLDSGARGGREQRVPQQQAPLRVVRGCCAHALVALPDNGLLGLCFHTVLRWRAGGAQTERRMRRDTERRRKDAELKRLKHDQLVSPSPPSPAFPPGSLLGSCSLSYTCAHEQTRRHTQQEHERQQKALEERRADLARAREHVLSQVPTCVTPICAAGVCQHELCRQRVRA